MKYSLQVQVLEKTPEIEISADRFESLQSAHRSLTAGASIEEKFEILLSNYLELEKVILEISAEQMVRGEISYSRIFDSRIALNRMLVNLLTTARLYLDHLPHHCNGIIGKNRQAEVVAFTNQEYDGDFRYRFMDALRNYVQHRGFPAHAISFPSDRVEKKRRDFVFSLEFASLRQHLADDEKFKKAVLKESPEMIDLKGYSRYYIERLSVINKKVRDLTDPALGQARVLIENAMLEYKSAYDRKPLGLAAICEDLDGKVVSTVPLLLDWDDLRIKLRARNGEIVNLRDRCVTNAIRSA